MKNIVKCLSVFVLVLSSFSCEEENNFQEPDIVQVPVYSLTDISGSGAPFKINVYRDTSLIIEYISEVNPLSFASSNYSDSSTNTEYQVSVTKVDNETSVNYVISGDKITGVGTLTVDSTDVFDIMIAEEMVFN